MYMVEQFYKQVLKKEPPYYAKYPLTTIIWKPIRKYINVVIIPNVPFTNLRVALYRMIGFNIGKNVFIGMKCYLDDVAIEKMIIEENVTISYGCYFASHGKGQTHTMIHIKKEFIWVCDAISFLVKMGLLLEKSVLWVQEAWCIKVFRTTRK